MSDQGPIEVLRASDPDQFERWERIWEETESGDPHAHPAYALEFETAATTAACISWRGGDVILPLMLRHLHAEAWTTDECELLDAETPYGYGGPLARPGLADVDHEVFLTDLRRWAESAQVVSLAGRLRVVENGFELPARTIRQNIVRTTRMPLDEMWYDYEHKVRKNVKRAKKHNVEVLVDESGEHLGDFEAIYESTLDRRAATSRYRFGTEFYKNLISRVPGTTLFHARLDEQIVSSEIVLSSGRWAYSFLGGTLPEAFVSRANDLLKHEIMRWCHETGKEGFVLGGGYEPEDGIFRYKKSFAPSGLVPFQLWAETFMAQSYDSLLEQRNQWEETRVHSWVAADGYFPAYRAPGAIEEA